MPWDPDGAGPLPPRIVVAGDFTVAGSVVANRIATFEPLSGTWAALGSGANGSVYALIVMPNGQLVAGGIFTTCGGVTVNGVAIWNGANWSPLGTGIDTILFASVNSLTALANGDLVVGGSFSSVSGVLANCIARWNGSTWSPLGSGMSPWVNVVSALTTLPNGDLIAGGTFPSAGGVAVNNVARWNGSTWSAIGTGTNGGVGSLLVRPNGDVVAGGWFTTAGGVAANSVARWNGSTWSSLGAGVAFQVNCLAPLPNGNLAASGNQHVHEWNGTAWSPLGAGFDSSVLSLAVLPNGELLASGFFTMADGHAARHLARWNGTTWLALLPGTNDAIRTLLSLPNGDLVAGGMFDTIETATASRLAIRSNGVWSPLGGGIVSPGAIVDAVLRLPNGDLVVSGAFSMAGTVPAACIAKWNGSSWSPFGSGMTNPGGLQPRVSAIALLPNGDLVGAGEFSHAGGVLVNHVARWNGTTWSPLGSGFDNPAFCMVSMPDGSLVAAGRFGSAGGVACNAIARWNGSAWSPLGGGLTYPPGIYVYTLAVGSNGDLFAGGNFTVAGGSPALHIARWNGAAWSPLGPGLGNFQNNYIAGLFALPNGHVLAGGNFRGSGTQNIDYLARWNGSSWSSLGAQPNQAPLAFTSLPNGDVFVGGVFTAIGNAASACVAALHAPCPASVAPTGPGCQGSGAAQLSALSLPWIGGTVNVEAAGLPGNALAIGVLGFGTIALPLDQILPQGVPGCSLLVTPDLLAVLPVTAGTASWPFAIPDSAPLIGLVLHEQFVPFAFDPQGAFLAITATNALALTLGTF